MWTVALTGLGFGLALIVAIGAQNAHVLRSGLRREHVGLVVAICAVSDLLLIVVGAAGAPGDVDTTGRAPAPTAANAAGVVEVTAMEVTAVARSAGCAGPSTTRAPSPRTARRAASAP